MLRQHVGILGSRSLSVSALRARRRVRRAIGLGEDVPAHHFEGDAPIWGERNPRGRLHSGLSQNGLLFESTERRIATDHSTNFISPHELQTNLDRVFAPWINSSTVESTWFIWWPQWSRLANLPRAAVPHLASANSILAPIESPVVVPAPPTPSLADASSAAPRRHPPRLARARTRRLRLALSPSLAAAKQGFLGRQTLAIDGSSDASFAQHSREIGPRALHRTRNRRGPHRIRVVSALIHAVLVCR